MKVLVACETSGVVRDAFLKRGHDAWSCDLLPSDRPTNRHIVGDARPLLQPMWWDMLIVAHPPCTRLCNSGVRWLRKAPPGKTLEQMWDDLRAGAALFSDFWNAPIVHIAVENPIMHGHAKALIANYQPPSQIVQPWWWGDPVFKGIGLYLKNLPLLEPGNQLVPPKAGTDEHRAWSRIHREPPGPERWKRRSKFFPGVANAMADRWGGVIPQQLAA